MAEHSTHIRHVLLYEFESGHPATEAHRNLSQVFGTEAPSERKATVPPQSYLEKQKKTNGERLALLEREAERELRFTRRAGERDRERLAGERERPRLSRGENDLTGERERVRDLDLDRVRDIDLSR
ncbi:hypothetical protein NECAME_02485 [Necator americanus]|uniref:Mos1 transposase HTH domain-containing protein n=1 Tax=Necator americanus TaxID=51031 RepID=W2TFN3_NECAM|nr:hypothetical protein NECAME_02485 [Necator americanus]ETN80006.1 hypothetical protein NECAME_02485 [Necator americanus]